MTRLAFALPAAALALLGCTSTDLPTSGLLGDYGAFDSRGSDMLVQRVAEAEDLARYRRIRLDRVHLYLEPGSAGRALPVSVQRSLAARFGAALREELEAHYDLTQDLGLLTVDTLRVRAAITDIEPGDAEDGRVANATVELEIVDALTGDRLAAAVARRPARRVTTSTEEGLDEADHAFKEWARNLRLWLDDVMGS